MNVSRQLAAPIPNSYWVISGRFAAGEYPGAKATGEATAKLQAFLSSGVDHFIDLTEPGELIPYADFAQREANRLNGAIGYERYPIVDLSVPKRPDQMARILDAIDGALNAGKTVYVHCWGGVGRTGTVVGCWLVRHGNSGDAALRRIAELWEDVEKSSRVPRSPETGEQRAYVRNWAERTPRS